MKICISTHVNGCAGIYKPLYTWILTIIATALQSATPCQMTTPTCALNRQLRCLRILFYCSVFDCCKNKLSAFPSTITSSEVICLIWLELRGDTLWQQSNITACYNFVQRKGTHPITNNFLEVSVMKNAGGFWISINPTQKVPIVKLLFNRQNIDWSPGTAGLLSMFPRLYNNQSWHKYATGGF